MRMYIPCPNIPYKKEYVSMRNVGFAVTLTSIKYVKGETWYIHFHHPSWLRG